MLASSMVALEASKTRSASAPASAVLGGVRVLMRFSWLSGWTVAAHDPGVASGQRPVARQPRVRMACERDYASWGARRPNVWRTGGQRRRRVASAAHGRARARAAGLAGAASRRARPVGAGGDAAPPRF